MTVPIIMEPQPSVRFGVLGTSRLNWRGESWIIDRPLPVPVTEQCPYQDLTEEPLTVREVAGAWCWIVETGGTA